MSCIRCEIVRAKAIAVGMAGLRKTSAQIHEALVGRYGSSYVLDGRKIYRESPGERVLIHEGRR